MKLNIHQRLYAGFALAILLVVVIGAVSFATFQRQAHQSDMVKHSFRVLSQIQKVQKIIVDMETGRRGFRSTNEKKFLEPYTAGLQTMPAVISKLERLIVDNPSQQKKAVDAKEKINNLLAFWGAMGDDASAYTREYVAKINSAEKVKMDSLRVAISRMEQEENDLLGARENANHRTVQVAKWQLLAGIFLIFCMVLILINQVLGEFKKRSRLLKQVNRQKDEMENQQAELRQTNDELTMQTEALQASEEELRAQEEELRQVNLELTEINQAVELAREHLALKSQELETASSYKSEFLANMSHELRTPLNSVLILAKLLADNKDNNLTDKQIAHAKIIHKSGSDLLQLINDILDLSKIEAGKAELYLEYIPVEDIAEDLEQLFKQVAEEKNISFQLQIEPAANERIKTDKQKLEQVIKNLLSNAFKFTSVGGSVEVLFHLLVQNESKRLAISVKDNGIGIPAIKHQVIFEAFQQAEGSTTRKYGGTGLGLSISKELTKILQGRLEVTSKPGIGSEFTLIIPLEIDETIIPAKNDIPSVQTPSSLSEAIEQTLVPDDRMLLQKEDKILLVIEDDEKFATVIRDFAKTHDYKVVVALTGEEGLHCAKKYHPSAIILDMLLPGISGETLLRILKNNPGLKHVPVHVISAADNAKDISSGALAMLKKPVDKEDLEKVFTMIGEYLNSSVKHVLIISERDMKNEIKARLIEQRNYDITLDAAASADEALKKLKGKKYDCLIADIGTDIQKGIKEITLLYEALLPQHIPTIIYLDNDITTANELDLKKISDAVVRKSSLSKKRLLDEMELFLYKVQETSPAYKKRVSDFAITDTLLQNKTVLLVDDDMRNIFAISAVLEDEKMNVLTAHDGNEALTALQNNKDIGLVLMDIMMPEMDGYEAIKAIRNNLLLASLPVIALTAKAMTGDKEKCMEAGASDYITKPVDTQKLLSLMRVWLS